MLIINKKLYFRSDEVTYLQFLNNKNTYLVKSMESMQTLKVVQTLGDSLLL